PLTGCTPAPGRNLPHSDAVASSPVNASESDALVRFVDITRSAGIHFLHQSAKSKRKYLVETMGSGCAFIDADGDGWQDILLLNNAPRTGGKVVGNPHLTLYHNNRDGTFTDVSHPAGLDRESIYAMGVTVGDYDNDGQEDFYVSCVLGPGH